MKSEEDLVSGPQLDSAAAKACNGAIIVTGPARGGTTILGKLLHSLEGVEYSFEPPLLFSLFAILDSIEETQWRLLYETYLYEEFFLNTMAGRSWNTNRVDDSSIYRVKPLAEIEARLGHTLGKTELQERLANARIAFKMPDVVHLLPQVLQWYPQTDVVVITRDANEVFHSLQRKGWFGHRQLQERNEIWPCYRHQGLKVPFWVAREAASDWLAMDELHRIAYYYLLMNRGAHNLAAERRVRYRELLEQPQQTLQRICGTLNLRFGEKTAELLATVKPQRSEATPDLVSQLGSDVRSEVREFSELS